MPAQGPTAPRIRRTANKLEEVRCGYCQVDVSQPRQHARDCLFYLPAAEGLPGDDWRDSAACARAGLSPDAWFLDAGLEAAARAVRICEGCTVRQYCLDEAVHTNDMYSIRAGLLPTERRAMGLTTWAPRKGSK